MVYWVIAKIVTVILHNDYSFMKFFYLKFFIPNLSTIFYMIYYIFLVDFDFGKLWVYYFVSHRPYIVILYV